MLGRAWAVAIVLVAGGLAGCIGARQEGAPPLEAAASSQTGVVAPNQTAAPDGRGDIAAFKESNATETTGPGAMMHAHDYWHGQTRKVLLQADYGLVPLPLLPDGKAPGTAIADFDIPAPNLVYEGTQRLEVIFQDVRPWGTPSGTPHPYIHVLLDYLTAADEPGRFRTAGQATPGTPLVIDVKPTEADMPHSKGAVTTSGQTLPVEPTEFLLEYHNASYLSKVGNGDLAGGRLADPGSDGKTYRFVVPVDPQGFDSPYGQKSRWAFRFIARYGAEGCPDDGGAGLMQGCQLLPYEMSYPMRIVAYGHSTALGAEPGAS